MSEHTLEISNTEEQTIDSAFSLALETCEADLPRRLADIVKNRIEQLKQSAKSVNTRLEIDFLHNELTTWRLIEALHRTRSSSSVCRFAAIKAWLENLNKESSKAANASDGHDWDDLVDEEAVDTIRRNQFVMSSYDDFDTRPRQKRRLYVDEGSELEDLNKSLYKHLRNGDLDQAISLSEAKDEPWRTMLLRTFVENHKNAQRNAKILTNAKERAVWKNSCRELQKRDPSNKYGSLLYAVLCGDTEKILQLGVCASWEDVMWAYYNGRVEEAIDEQLCGLYTSTSNQHSLQSKFKAKATAKDSGLQREDPRHFFHFVQSAILENSMPLFITAVPTSSRLWIKDAKPSTDAVYLPHIQRFLSSLILYLREFKVIDKDDISDQMLYTYAEMNGHMPNFNPRVLGFYASKLPEQNQIKLFSNFLIDFDGDRDERAVLVEMGNELELNMVAILKRAHSITMTEFDEKYTRPTMASSPAKDLELSGEISTNASICLQALEWLASDSQLSETLVTEANKLIRLFLGLRKMYMVEAVLKAIPNERLDLCVLETHGALILPDYLDEFYGHEKLLHSVGMYHAWKGVYDAKPEDKGDFNSLELYQQWSDGLESLTAKLEPILQYLLKSRWLKAAQTSSDDGPFSGNTLRQIYIPEIVIQLHTILYETRDFMKENLKKSASLVQLVASEKEGLYKDIANAKKMGLVLEHLGKSQLVHPGHR